MCISGNTTMQDNIKLATRKSPLALRQANLVKENLIDNNIFSKVEIVAMTTSGDDVDQETFKKNGGKGLFLKELEYALIKGEADIAVHSMKDVPAKLDKSFLITSILKREDPRDVFISSSYKSIDEIISGTIGSSSPRRQAMLKHLSGNIDVIEMRGNIHTRLKKLERSDIDGILLAKAGLKRMDMGNLITEELNTDVFVPSPGQGVLCIECLNKNKGIMQRMRKIVHKNTEICASAERIFAAELDGDCMSPIGAYAEIKNNIISITGYVASIDGSKFIKNKIEGRKDDYKILSRKLSKIFIKMGSRSMLRC